MIDKEREQIVGRFLQERQKTTLAYYQYLTKPREYIPGVSLYMRELDFLNTIAQMEQPTVMVLATKLGVTHGAVSQTATRLAGKKLIVRKKNRNDQRSSIIALTKRGKRVVFLDNELRALLREKMYETVSVYSNEDFLVRLEGDRLMQQTLLAYEEIQADFMKRLELGVL